LPEEKEKPGVIRTLDSAIQGGIIFLLIFTPRAFGTVHTWSITISGTVAVIVFFSWLIKMVIQGELRWLKTPLNLPVIFITLFLLFQLAPLPPAALHKFSPDLYRVYSETIPGYGGHVVIASSNLEPEPIKAKPEKPSAQFDAYRVLSIYKWATWNDFKLFLLYLAVLFVFLNNITTERQLRRIVLVVISVGFGMALLGILQKLSGTQAIYWFWTTPSWIGRKPGFFGPFVNRNNFAGYMVMALPLTFGLLWSIRTHRLVKRDGDGESETERLERQDAGMQKGLLGFFAFIMVVALFMSLSRGGILSFIVVMFFMALVMAFRRGVRRRGRVAWFMTVAALAVLVSINMPSTQERLSTLANLEEDYSALYRVDVWKDTRKMLRDNPILGTGLGTFQYMFPRYRDRSATNRFYWDHAHNDYLETWSDIGIIGLLLLLWMGYRIYKDVLFCHILGLTGGVAHKSKKSIFRKRRDASAIALSVGALAAMTGILVHSFVDFNLRIPANALLFSLAPGMAIIAIHLRHTPDGDYLNMRQVRVSLRPWMRVVLVPALAALGLVLFWWPVARPLRAELTWKEAKAMPLSSDINVEGKRLKLQQKAAALDPANALYQAVLGDYQRGMMYRMWGADRYKYAYYREEAEKSFNTAINLNPTNGFYHTRQGWVQNDLKDEKAASREFFLGAEYDPTSAYAHWSRANWAMRMASHDPSYLDTAILEYKKAIAIRPFIAREALKSYSKFARNFDELKQIIPPIREAHEELARFLLDEKLWEKNRRAFKKHVMEEADSASYYLTQARMDYSKGKYKEAIETLVEFIKLNDANAEAHFWLALYADQHGRELGYYWEFSKKHFQEAIRIDPVRAFYRKWYGRHLYYHGEYEKSAEQLSIVLRKGKDGMVYRMLGDAYRAMGETDKAIVSYRRALRLSPDNLQFIASLAKTYYKDGRYLSAEKQFSRILELDPNNQEAAKYLKSISIETKRYLTQRPE